MTDNFYLTLTPDEISYPPTFHLTDAECRLIETYLKISQRSTANAAAYLVDNPELPELLRFVGEQ